MIRLYKPNGDEQLPAPPTAVGVLQWAYHLLECDTVQCVNVLYCGEIAQLLIDETAKVKEDVPPINTKASAIWWTTARIAENASRTLKHLHDHGLSYERKIMCEVLTAAVSHVMAASLRDPIVGNALLLTGDDMWK